MFNKWLTTHYDPVLFWASHFKKLLNSDVWHCESHSLLTQHFEVGEQMHYYYTHMHIATVGGMIPYSAQLGAFILKTESLAGSGSLRPAGSFGAAPVR